MPDIRYEHHQVNPEDIFECRKCRSCGICDKVIASNQKFIDCKLCKNYVHKKCNKFDDKQYNRYLKDKNPTFCFKCNQENLPFLNINDKQHELTMDGINYPEESDVNNLFLNQSQLNIINKINNLTNQYSDNNDADFDDAIPLIDCQYYSTDSFKSMKFNSSKEFSILHLNIHSIEAHIEDFRIALQLIDYKFDFICLSESKIIKNSEPKIDISIDSYQAPVGTPTISSKGGVLIYVKEGINFEPRDDLIMSKDKELESYFIEVINEKKKNSIVGVVYRHPCMDANSFIDEFIQPLNEKLLCENKQIFIAGDFNFDLLKTNFTETFNFFESMISGQLLPSILIPTKINSVNDTVIDNIFTNQINPDIKSGNLNIIISDHLPSFFIMPRDNQIHIPKTQKTYVRDMKMFDRINFTLDYLSIDWTSKLNRYKDDANKAFLFFHWQMNSVLDKHMPWKKLSKRDCKRKYKPWISNEILNKIKDKNRKFNKYAKSKDITRRQTLKNDYRNAQNEITELIRKGKRDYYNRYFTENKTNIHKIWKEINEIVNVKSKVFNSPSTIKSNGKVVSDSQEMATSFNTYFTNIAEDIIRKRKYNGRINHEKYLTEPLDKSFVLYDFDATDVSVAISTLNQRKGSFPNGLPTKLLIMFKDLVSTPLATIFNISQRTGTFPDLLKFSKTIPVFKKGSKLNLSNYRPISLLSNINKIFEKLMHGRVFKFLEKNKSLYHLQFGFRSKHSTDHALIQITENIKNALDNGKYVCGVFIDLQKAFDTVNHDILIDKLSYYGIRGLSNQWFKSYLSNRKQYVSINGYNSETMNVKHGVPQGSVLGPLLFLIYINDLYKCLAYGTAYHFADDTNLMVISETQKQMQKHMNIYLKLLYKWLIANKISLNCSKTEIIIFHETKIDQRFEYNNKINGHKLVPTNKLKYLGITLDNKLNGEFHCDVLTGKLNRANGMLSKVRHYVTKNELISIYHAIFASHLRYGCQIWALENTMKVERIGKLQNKAIRIINFEDFRASADPLYYQCKILKLSDMVKLNNCLLVHDFLRNDLPDCFANYFEKLESKYTSYITRNSDLSGLYVPSVNKTSTGIHSVTFRSIQCWNKVTKTYKVDLSKLSRFELKKIITRMCLFGLNANE